MELARFIGFLHPALVHFPLVLLLVSVALEAIGYFRRDARLTWAAQGALLLGTVATLFAFVAGNFAEIWAARDGIPQDAMENHELLATITSWLFVFLAAGRLFLGMGQNRRGMAVYLVCAFLGCMLLGLTGHRGAMLVYEHGAGVHAMGLHNLPTHEDLFILRQKQDPDALFYSNQMHHIFGWMVLLLGGMLLADMVSPALGERLRRLSPFLLLAGGVFLMIYSDQDAWPLYHIKPYRSIWDKEVLMHKTYATLMLIVGLAQLRQLLKRRGEAANRKQYSRYMAVFALVGGALLFTHVHSGAPYANVAAGVYIHHTVMGFVALCIGAVKLIEDTLLQRRERLEARAAGQPPLHEISQRRLQMGLAWAYPCLMLTIAVLLINYNEGLPWFLGYRNLSLHAPHGGYIAPLGADRAELCYDPVTTRFDLYTLNQDSDAAKAIAPQSVQLVVKEGTDSTDIEMTPDAPRSSVSHFVGTAPFLRGVPLFQSQALFYWGKRRTYMPTGVMLIPLIADFEPWADPNRALPHSAARYVCPMHETQGANTPGNCPLCGMTLIPNKPPRLSGVLHDAGYQMDFAFSPDTPSSSTPIHLTFTPRRSDGGILTDLDVVHTKKLHLIIASSDLSFFDHVHPIPQSDGSLTLDYAFPHPGDYHLYADLTPKGDRNQVFILPVTIPGSAPARQPFIETPAQAKNFGDYRVSLALSPDPPVLREETQLAFTVYLKGKPVTDLEPYLGAGGHCVILSEDSTAYLHSHPLETGETTFGPTVVFHTRFLRAGLYKVWGQFQHHGQKLTADFTLRVR